MSSKRIPIPPLLRRRPRYGGLPVPFMSPTDRNTGRPLFGFDDFAKKLDVARRRVCGQCGESLDKVFVFIGDDRGCARGVFSEPPMHLSCARYVLQVCPYFTKDQHGQIKAPKDPFTVVLNEAETKLPPADKWGVYLTRDFKAKFLPGLVFVAGEQVCPTIWYAHGATSL